MSNPFSGAVASMTTINRRANRSEYIIGMFAISICYVLAAAAIIGVISVASEPLGSFLGFIFVAIYALGVVLLTKNRFNDFGSSGWWQLIPFASIIAIFIPGDAGENQYGARK